MNNWKKSSKKNDVEVYTYNIEGNYTGFMGISELQYSAEDIMHVLNKPEIPFSCNPFGEKMEILEQIDPETSVIYMKFKGMMLVSGRDFVILCKKILIEDASSKGDKNYAILSFSVDHPQAQSISKSTVRADMLIGGWILRKISDNKTSVINMAINDLKGSIPKFVINAGASTHSGLLLNFKNKLDELKKNGLLLSQLKSADNTQPSINS